MLYVNSVQFSRSVVSDSATPWIAARQASLSITISRSSLRLTAIESVMPSSHLILCRPLLLLSPIPPSIRVFSSESTLHMRWPKYWVSASASFPPKKSQGWFPLEWTDWISLQSNGDLPPSKDPRHVLLQSMPPTLQQATSDPLLCRRFLDTHTNSMKLWAMPCRATQDGWSWWRVLTKHGPLEKRMANHFSVLGLRTPWTVWKDRKRGHWKINSPGR